MPVEHSSKNIKPYAVKGVCSIMGTFVSITAIGGNPEKSRLALSAAFKEMHRINNLMSVHSSESEVSRLNKNKLYRNISSDTLQVIKRSIYFSELTHGAFDITIWPVLHAWQKHAKKNRKPSLKELKEKLNYVGYKNIRINGHHIKFLNTHTAVTLAGVAKGYAVDKAIGTLKKNGIRHAIVNAGGDIRTLGGKTNGVPWKVGILDPRNRRKFLTTVNLKNQAIATSGGYRRSMSDLLDPKGGTPVNDIISFTVITEKAIDADVLATAALIMGKEKGIPLIESFREAKGFCVTKDGQLIKISEK